MAYFLNQFRRKYFPNFYNAFRWLLLLHSRMIVDVCVCYVQRLTVNITKRTIAYRQITWIVLTNLSLFVLHHELNVHDLIAKNAYLLNVNESMLYFVYRLFVRYPIWTRKWYDFHVRRHVDEDEKDVIMVIVGNVYLLIKILN